MPKTQHFSLQRIYASYIVAGQVNDENQATKMEEAIEASISMARHVENIVGSDAQISGQARRRLSNTVREE